MQYGYGYTEEMILPRIVGSSKITKSLLFDSTEYMKTLSANIPDVISGTGKQFTIYALIKPTAIASGEYLFSKRDAGPANFLFEFRLNVSTRINFTYRNVTDSSNDFVNSNSGLLTANNWYLIYAVINGDNSKIFLNGVDVTNATNIQSTDNYGSGTKGTYWEINSLNNGTVGNYNGNLGQLGILNFAASLAQHQNHYNSGCPKLIGNCYTPSQISANIIQDNFTWNGSEIVAAYSMTSVNMEESDITTTTPC